MFARHKPARWATRVAVAGLAAGVVALTGSAAALARDNKPVSPKAAAAPQGLPAGDAAISRGNRIADLSSNKGDAPVVHFYLTYANGKKYTAYCIDFNHHARETGKTYTPGTWDASSVRNLPQVQWILTNSYPHANAADVLKKAGADVTGLTDPDFVAYVGTQTSIWHFSDGIDITGNGHKLTAAEYAAAMKVRDYLVKNATKAPEPAAPSVAISPRDATGYAGKNVGPFTVTTGGDVTQVKLSVDGGGQIVDEAGNALSDVKNGTKFWVKNASAGTVTVTAQGAGMIPTGQVYTAPKPEVDTYQKLILADTAPRAVSDTVGVTLTASPSPSPSSASPSASSAPVPSASGTAGGGLPVTGTSLPIIIGVAVALVVAGGAVVLLARRRRMSS